MDDRSMSDRGTTGYGGEDLSRRTAGSQAGTKGAGNFGDGGQIPPKDLANLANQAIDTGAVRVNDSGHLEVPST